MAGPSRIVRNTFVAGLLVLVPIVLTAVALQWLFTSVDRLARPLAEVLVGRPVPGLGFLLTVAIVFLTGLFFSRGPLRRLLDSVEGLLGAVPVVGTVYGTTKKVLAGFGAPGPGSAFRAFVFARLRGRTTPGFLMSRFTLRQADGVAAPMCAVYVPTNHLYVGDVVVLSPEDVLETDLSVEDGVSLILSAGASMPVLVTERRGRGEGREKAGDALSTRPGGNP
jgi:uncharacterized membrane protein